MRTVTDVRHRPSPAGCTAGPVTWGPNLIRLKVRWGGSCKDHGAHTVTTHASLMFYRTELSEETMQTPVEIDFQDMSARPEVHASIEKHVADLEQRYGRVTACRVVLKGPGGHHRTGGRVVYHRDAWLAPAQ